MSRETKHLKLTPLAAAVATALATSPLVVAQEKSVTLEEIVVTSRKRAESVMDIPAAVQALSGEDLKDMGARGMSDYARFIPAVNIVDYGSGLANFVFRGATSDPGYVTQSTSSLYMDEISLTTQGQQPSIRMVDIERVEALSGPQGTLYGSDSQAGTLRLISNKAQMNETSFTVDGSIRNGSEGEGSYDGSVVANFPLVEDKLALRVVGYKAKDGGYIDNVYGKTITNDLKADDLYGRSPSGWGTLDNADIVEDDINDYEAEGWRAAVRWDINQDWSATLSTIQQKSEAGSFNGFDPNVGDLQIIRYNEEYMDVDLDISSLTVEGDLGFAQLVAATSYYNSETVRDQDITNYHKSYSAYYCIHYAGDAAAYAPYYFAVEDGYMYASGLYCSSPTVEGDFFSKWYEESGSDRFSTEVRLSSQGDTFDWLVGAFYEESNYWYEEHWGYPTGSVNGRGELEDKLYQNTVSYAYNEWQYGESFPDASENWYAKSSADAEQTAVFGEVVWHMNDRMDLTAGLRWFDRENVTTYYEEHPTGRLDDAGVEVLPGEDSEVIPKISLSYRLDSDNLVYALWTEGYRPGGTNRQRGNPSIGKEFFADKMTNFEAGYKGTFADGAATLNVTAYQMDWSDYQFELIDPSYQACEGGGDPVAGLCGQPYQVLVSNAGDAHIDGLSMELNWALTSNLVVGMNGEWLEAETDTDIDLSTIFIPSGSQLPTTPDFTGGAWATYSWDVPQYNANAYVRLQWSYSGSRLGNLEPVEGGSNPQWNEPSYSLGDLCIGMRNDSWEASIFLNNITDERVNYTHAVQGGYTQQNVDEGRMRVETVYTNRPREFGVRFIRHFGD